MKIGQCTYPCKYNHCNVESYSDEKRWGETPLEKGKGGES
jgi:hypothetical protein